MPEDSKSPMSMHGARRHNDTKSNVLDVIRSDLIAGLVVVIPLATTLWLATVVARWVVVFLTSAPKRFNLFQDLIQNLNPLLLGMINLLVGILVPLLGIFLIGLIARNVLTRSLFEFGEGVLARIPFAGAVYKTLKQLLETLLDKKSRQFKRVVLVEYPREGIYAIGFVTGDDVGESLQKKFPRKMVSLFIPTSPNPTTGWYALVPSTSVKVLDISVEVAFRTIISAGIVNPDEQPVASSTNPGLSQTSRRASASIAPQPEG